MRRTPRLLTAPLILWLCAACSERDDMKQGARLHPFEARPGSTRLLATDAPPAGTVPRDPGPFELVPRPPLTLELLRRGRIAFDVSCSPCHARDGYGDGVIARHGFPPPPSFHDPDIRALDDQHYFDVITDGLGKMPSYGSSIQPPERWAIVAYVRALQLSQNAPPGSMPRSLADGGGS